MEISNPINVPLKILIIICWILTHCKSRFTPSFCICLFIILEIKIQKYLANIFPSYYFKSLNQKTKQNKNKTASVGCKILLVEHFTIYVILGHNLNSSDLTCFWKDRISGYKVTDGRMVRAGVSVTWSVLSWPGGRKFEPRSGRTWSA